MRDNFIKTYLSVDCVVFGFDGEALNVLLVQRDQFNENDGIELKLPGSLIFDQEDVDDSAERVLFELTGIKKIKLKQFRCFADPRRASQPEDRKWLDREYKPEIDRLITVAYLALRKINSRLNNHSKYRQTKWCPTGELPRMPFDHNQIVEESLVEIRRWVELEPYLVFELLPTTFTISQMHKLYQAIYDRELDIRNFYKKVTAMEYIIDSGSMQKNVSHRAARLFRFDKKLYNQTRKNL